MSSSEGSIIHFFKNVFLKRLFLLRQSANAAWYPSIIFHFVCKRKPTVQKYDQFLFCFVLFCFLYFLYSFFNSSNYIGLCNIFAFHIKKTRFPATTVRIFEIWPLLMIWSWSINNLKEFYKLKYAPGPYLKCTLLQKNVCYMLLKQCAFQIWSWGIFRIFFKIINGPGPYGPGVYVLDHKSRPKSQKSRLHKQTSPNNALYDISLLVYVITLTSPPINHTSINHKQKQNRWKQNKQKQKKNTHKQNKNK